MIAVVAACACECVCSDAAKPRVRARTVKGGGVTLFGGKAVSALSEALKALPVFKQKL